MSTAGIGEGGVTGVVVKVKGRREVGRRTVIGQWSEEY